MTALAANKLPYGNQAGQLELALELLAADSQVFYLGALAMANSAGKIAVGADTASCRIAGVVAEALTTSTSNTTKVKLKRGHIERFVADSSLDLTDLFKNVFIKDDATVQDATAATNDVKVGMMVGFETGYAYVWVGVFGPTDS